MKLSPFLFAITLLVSVGLVQAQDFVPFVIPAETNSQSVIAPTACKPIDVNSARLQARDSHFWLGDERVRLWGVNLSFAANFPTHADAVKIAARMAAAGVNTVRCHHMDTSRWPDGIWDAKDPKKLSTEALDRLDFFINELAKRGIFVDLNLHVGRAHSQYLHLAKPNTDYDKVVGIFTPALVTAQRQYASDLLTHKNPYRGSVLYAKDPAVALVEITNEDSFFMWSGDQDLRALPAYYAGILQGQFDAWLKDKYGSTSALSAAWAKDTQPLGRAMLTNIRLALDGKAVPQGWNLEQHDACKAQLVNAAYQGQQGLRVQILSKDDTDWHLQLNQGGLAVKAGSYYTVTFQAAADGPRSIACSVGQAHDPWRGLGLSRRIDLTGEWKTFTLGFMATEDDTNARVNFSFGNNSTTFYLANIEMRPGGQVGLAAGETLEAGTVALFQENESQARIIDRMTFLARTEKSYFDGMRGYVKQDLGCGALVTGTIVFGPLGLYAQSDMDFIDGHAYWQHPSFPGQPWDAGNWTVEQIAMTDHPDQTTLFGLAAQRLAGKPYTVTEYNHPAPSDYQVECVPMIASFAAAQDWDGVWLYTYSHSNDQWDRQVLYSYFDIDTNPAKWGLMRAGASIFRQAGIPPLGRRVTVPLVSGGSDTLAGLADLHLRHDRDLLAAVSNRSGLAAMDLISKAVDVSLSGDLVSGGNQTATIQWSVDQGQGLYGAVGESAWTYTGHRDRFGQATQGRVQVTAPAFAAIAETPLDGLGLADSRKILVTACGRCENVGMGFSADRRTVGRNWGKAPVQIEAVTSQIRLTADNWRCQALGPDGLPQADVPIDPNKQLLCLSPQYKTMWYLLSR